MDNITSRRSLLGAGIVAGAVLLVAPSVFAQSTAGAAVKFTTAAFAAAQTAGKTIVIDVTAPWCPTCKVQAPILKSLLTKPEFKDVVIMEVDFDSQKAVLQTLKVQSQSTLIAFKGKLETSRSVGDTKASSIESLFKTAI
jgi:thioredoxin 1